MDNKTIVNPIVKENSSIVGVCSVCPEILFEGASFCLTGKSHRYVRKDFESLILSLGGFVSGSVSKNINYLVIGSEGNPSWAYACYGRKVEMAVQLRKQGHKIV